MNLTPQEIEAKLAKLAKIEEQKLRASNKQKEKWRTDHEYRAKAQAAARAYYARPEVKARAKQYMKEYRLRPGVKEKIRATGTSYMRVNRAEVSRLHAQIAELEAKLAAK